MPFYRTMAMALACTLGAAYTSQAQLGTIGADVPSTPSEVIDYCVNHYEVVAVTIATNETMDAWPDPLTTWGQGILNKGTARPNSKWLSTQNLTRYLSNDGTHTVEQGTVNSPVPRFSRTDTVSLRLQGSGFGNSTITTAGGSMTINFFGFIRGDTFNKQDTFVLYGTYGNNNFITVSLYSIHVEG